MALLVNHFNPETIPALMCRHLVSVGYDGALYDCDFNQMLELPLGAGPRTHLRDRRPGGARGRADRHGCALLRLHGRQRLVLRRRAGLTSTPAPSPRLPVGEDRARRSSRSLGSSGSGAPPAAASPSSPRWVDGARLLGTGRLRRRLRAGGGRVRARLAADARGRRDLRRRAPARSTSSSPRRSAAALAFLVSRYLARAAVERRLAGNPRFAAIDRAVGAAGTQDRVPAAALAGLPLQPAELRARPHARALRRLRDRVGRHAARHAALRVSRARWWATSPRWRAACGPSAAPDRRCCSASVSSPPSSPRSLVTRIARRALAEATGA